MIDLDELPQEGTYPVKDIEGLPIIPRSTDDVVTIGYVNVEGNEFIQVLTLSPNDYSSHYAILIRQSILNRYGYLFVACLLLFFSFLLLRKSEIRI